MEGAEQEENVQNLSDRSASLVGVSQESRPLALPDLSVYAQPIDGMLSPVSETKQTIEYARN